MKPNLKQPILNSRGQSLVQVLIAVAIMGILMVAMTSMQTNQQREAAALTEKLAVMEIARSVSSSLASPSSCQALLDPANFLSSAVYDPTSVAASNVIIPMAKLPAVGISAGAIASTLTNALAVLPASGLLPGIRLVVTGPTTATLEVNFDQNRLVRAIHNLSFPNISITTTPLGGLSKITGCTGSTTGGGGKSGNWCGAFLGDGSGAIQTISMACQGYVPPCSGTTSITGCYGYNVSSICPTGYTPQAITTMVAGSPPTSSVLYTCAQ